MRSTEFIMYASFLSCDLGILLQGKRQHIKWKWKRHGLLIKYIGFHLLLASYLFQWSPTFLAQGPVAWKTVFLQTRVGWMVSGWLKCITFKFTSCCVAQFLTGLDWYQSTVRRLETPDLLCSPRQADSILCPRWAHTSGCIWGDGGVKAIQASL